MEALKLLAKRVLVRAAPGPFNTLQAIRARRHVCRLQRQWGLERITDAYIDLWGLRVRAGPFQGMMCQRRRTWSGLVPKLIGSYEEEITPWLELLLGASGRRSGEDCHLAGEARYDVAVNVGCADGYYAVGLALRLPRTTVHAYDLDPLARRLTRDLAELNGVASRVRVHARCDTATLSADLRAAKDPLVLSDCEGYEGVLLDPRPVPELQRADVLVEFHDHAVPGVSAAVLRRFEATHDVAIVESTQRDTTKYPVLDFLPEDDQRAIVDERRPRQTFGLLRVRWAGSGERVPRER